MNVSFHPPLAREGRERRGAFALVVTLLILSLLVVVAVSYLSSMVSERQTADAYSAKARAEQAAQAGVDSAMAILAQSFRDFPDSATVWDPQQSENGGTSKNNLVVSSDVNEGTSLYLRAVPTTASVNGAQAIVADPRPNGTSTLANDAAGNNPNNQACKTFMLPLISGVLGGRAQLLANKKAMFKETMNLAEPDPAKQNFVDLNSRRYGPDPASPNPTVQSYGDIWGVIGSPPDWTGTPTPSATTVVGPTKGKGYGPKPARAYWVDMTGGDGRKVGRYAFWIEDESFRANVNYANLAAKPTEPRIDNAPDTGTKLYPVDPDTKQPYISTPSDAGLGGVLTAFGASDVQNILEVRSVYPKKFFPEPLAFAHLANSTSGASALSSSVFDSLRYLTTTQSGTLNLTRHGTQRLNLNTTVSTANPPTDTAAIQKQVDQIVQAIKFHLPNFGQRFYRLSTATDAGTLNNVNTVGLTSALTARYVSDPKLIYPYKVAANIRDYIDTDSQPTAILTGGTVAPASMTAPIHPMGEDSQANPYWAIGKEAAPFLQETAIRFRPFVPQSAATGGKGNWKLAVDYYLEFWNMSDRDIYAVAQSDPTKASMNDAKIAITYQQAWKSYPSGIQLTCTTPPDPKAPNSDLIIDLSTGVNAAGSPVVFRAGTATVITTDPDYQSYNFTTPTTPTHNSVKYTSLTGKPNRDTTFLCPILAPGTRTYAGKLPGTDYGIIPEFRDGSQDYQTEVTLYNKYGYFDSASFGIAEGGNAVSTFSDTATGDGDYCNYSYGGSLFGNGATAPNTPIPSQAGDPRTNNEQMYFSRISGATGDQSRYYNGDHTLGYPNANYVQPVGGTFTAPGATKSSNFLMWPDYYSWQNTTGFINPVPATAPVVMADRPLASIGQLGDVYDPARVNGSVIELSRGGGRTFRLGQRDDRTTYDPAGSPNPGLDCVPASQGWAAWRLADVFSAGPVDSQRPSVQEPIELPARVNINGVLRDNGAALRALLTDFKFQPATVDSATGTSEPLFHTPKSLENKTLSLQPTDTSGLSKLVAQMAKRLQTTTASNNNVPWGPFFERGELGELEMGGIAIFGKNPASTFAAASNDLAGSSVDMNRTFDRGREEIFRRLAEMICTRGDTFTVYTVGQSLTQNGSSQVKITGTHRMRVTFRLVPQAKDPNTGVYVPFHPAYNTQSDSDPTILGPRDYDPAKPNVRFAKPDRYDVQILAANVF